MFRTSVCIYDITCHLFKGKVNNFPNVNLKIYLPISNMLLNLRHKETQENESNKQKPNTIYVLHIDIYDSDLSWKEWNRYKNFNSILKRLYNGFICLKCRVFSTSRRKRQQEMNGKENSLNETAFTKDENVCFSAITRQVNKYQKL